MELLLRSRRPLCGRLVLRALAVAFVWLATAPANAAGAAASGWPDIVFYIAKGGPNACGHGCDQWIAADGAIDAEAAQRLRLLLSKLSGHKLPVFFNSPGGQTAGAIELGRLLRKERLVAGVGRTTPAGCDRDKFYDDSCKILKHDGVTAELEEATAMCHSACVYVLAGAPVRLIPPGARLGIHAAVIKPRTPLPPDLIAAAKAQADRRIDSYLQEMGMNRALFATANAIPHQSLRFLRRDELIRFGLDRREFGETGWHFAARPRPAISKAYFLRTGPGGLPGARGLAYRNAFLRMNCGDARSMRLTLGIEMARDEAGIDQVPVSVALNGARVGSGWSAEFPIRSDPTRFDVRSANVTVETMAGVDDGASIEISTPLPKSGAPSAVRLAMDGFSEAYAKLRKTCDAARNAAAACPSPGASPRCVTDARPLQKARLSPNL